MEPTPPLTIRPLEPADRDRALDVINTAARWYADILPPEELDDVEMTREDWTREAQRMTWYGAFDGDALIGVVGMEPVDDVVLLRHWYVLPARQRSGAGSLLREHLERQAAGARCIIAGTYRANVKARGALERAGYELSADPQAVLRRYYDIPADRMASSVTYERSIGARAG